MEHIDIAFTKDIVSKKQRQGCKLCLWTECIQQSQAHKAVSMNRMYPVKIRQILVA